MIKYINTLFLMALLFTINALAFAPVENRLMVGQRMKVGEKLESRNGQFYAMLGKDGTLGVYRKEGTLLWSSETNDPGAAYFGLERDGNLSVRRKDGSKIWQSHTVGGKGTYLIMQDDGNLVIYVETPASAIWASDTGGM